MTVLRRLGALTACSVVALLSGCAAVYEGRYDFRDGWRKGEVDAILSWADVQRERLPQCRRPAAAADDVWVVIRYIRSGHLTKFAAPAPNGSFRVAEAVYVNPGRDCAEALGRTTSPSG